MSKQLILDVDTGNDDAIAILMAALHPELSLLGITTVGGNLPVAVTTDNTLRVLECIGAGHIPVFRGLDRPFAPRPFPRPAGVASTGALAHQLHLDLPAPVGSARPEPAVEWLVRTLRGATSPVTLVPVAPLTNIAAAVTIAPDIVEHVDEVVLMGGASGRGNESSQAEFNVHEDPVAAHVLLNAGFKKITMIPLDATRQALISREDCAGLRALGSAGGNAAATIIEGYIAARQDQPWAQDKDAAPIHDALCVAYALDPNVVGTADTAVSIDTVGFHTYGRTIVDPLGRDGGTPNVSWAHSADAKLFSKLLFGALSG